MNILGSGIGKCQSQDAIAEQSKHSGNSNIALRVRKGEKRREDVRTGSVTTTVIESIKGASSTIPAVAYEP